MIRRLNQLKNGTHEREGLETLLMLDWIPEEICPSLCTVGKPPIRFAERLLKQRGNRSENRKREEELWKWGITENNSFQMLKREVCKQVELAYADFEKPFRISTDASVEGLGAVLEQQDDIGNWRPLAYGSRRVTDAERRYDAHKLVTER